MARRIAPKQRLSIEAPWPPPAEQTLEEVLAELARREGFTRVAVANPTPPPACAPSRWDPPEQLPGTGMFSAYGEWRGQVEIVKLLRSMPFIYRKLRDEVAALGEWPGKSGPKRMAGCWACAKFAYVESGEADVQTWHSKTTPELWQACGMERKPGLSTTEKRLAETEDVDEAFAQALDRLVQHCRKRDPRIGQAVSVDATMSETNARLHKLGKNGEVPTRIGRLPVLSAPRMPTQIVDDLRRAENSELPEARKLQVSEYLDITTDVASQVAGRFKLINLKSGPYLSRDPDAGVRAYTRNGKLLKYWHGYFLVQGVDHFSGLPLRAHGFAADENESTHYTTVVEKSIATLGRVPDFVTTDKAYYVFSCFEWSVLRGITLVSPYKAPSKGAPKAQATMDCDRHGVPHCRSCGEGTDQVTFFLEPAKGRNGKPRPILRYQCAAPQNKECLGVQEKSCLIDPMRLLPVWRTHPAYSEARTRHQALERNHYEARSRANAKPRHFETRSKRISRRGAVMRLNIYAIIAWMKACLINGWLGTPVLNPELARDADRQRRAGRKTKYDFVQHRVRLARLRSGDVGGGRLPHRTRGKPPPRRAPTSA